VDIRLPLKRYKKIKKPGGESRIVKFKYERLGTFCYICGLLGHSDIKCPKLFDIADITTVTREWRPELRADTGRKQGGDSRWLRQAGDRNRVAPNPVMMSNNCDNKKSGCNSQGVNADEEKIMSPAISDIFKNPAILFPKVTNTKLNANISEEDMEEDMNEELILESDRKRTRSQQHETHVKADMHAHGNKNENSTERDTSGDATHFLSAGPGGASRGQ
jgi:hypothetical protein